MMTKRQESRTFGKLLREERLRLGLTQAELALVGGVSKATQVAYESDSTRPDSRYLSRVAVAEVDVLQLLTGRKQPAAVDWQLLFEIRDLIEEWAHERRKPTSIEERDGLLKVLYAQFVTRGEVDHDMLMTTFRLVG